MPRSASGGNEVAACSAAAMASTVGSMTQPQPNSAMAFQGVAVVVITGIPQPSASPMTRPKFSLNVGKMNSSAWA